MDYLDCETVQMTCPELILPTDHEILISSETTPVHEILYTTTDLSTKGIVVTRLQNHQTATVAMADLTITLFSSILAMLVVHRKVKYELLMIVTTLIVLSEMSQGKHSKY